MKLFAAKALALTVVFSLLLSSFGIARVTHFCDMRSHATQAADCGSDDKHSCCEAPALDGKSDAKPCCTTIVKMFRADLQSLFKTQIRIASDLIAQELLLPTWIEGIVNQPTLLPSQDEQGPPLLIGGREISIQICSFLI